MSATVCCAGARVAALAVHVAAEVVHDDLGALAREEQRVLAAEAASRAGDDRNPSVERTHDDLPSLATAEHRRGFGAGGYDCGPQGSARPWRPSGCTCVPPLRASGRSRRLRAHGLLGAFTDERDPWRPDGHSPGSNVRLMTSGTRPARALADTTIVTASPRRRLARRPASSTTTCPPARCCRSRLRRASIAGLAWSAAAAAS